MIALQHVVAIEIEVLRCHLGFHGARPFDRGNTDVVPLAALAMARLLVDRDDDRLDVLASRARITLGNVAGKILPTNRGVPLEFSFSVSPLLLAEPSQNTARDASSNAK